MMLAAKAGGGAEKGKNFGRRRKNLRNKRGLKKWENSKDLFLS